MGSLRRPRRLAPLLALGAGLVAAAACSGGTPRIRLDAAEARLSPSLVGVASIFLTIANPGDGDDALLGAQVDAPGAVTQIHAVRGGRMVESGRLVVPANGALELRPGGLHIMVFNLPRSTGPGDALTLRLRFETSGERRTSVPIGGGRSGRAPDTRAVSRRKGSST
jgi:copper(I)-binding protein